MKNPVLIFSAVALLCFASNTILAQNGPDAGPPEGFNPAQFQQHMLEQVRNNLDITNNDEWNAIQPLVQKVMDTRRELADGRMGPGPGGPEDGGPPGGPPPDFGPDGQPGPGGPDDSPAPPNGRGGPGIFGPASSVERQALQKAVDDKAPASQVKEALAKLREARKDKEAKLQAAQASLKSVLTPKQEAEAVLMGLLP